MAEFQIPLDDDETLKSFYSVQELNEDEDIREKLASMQFRILTRKT